MDLREFNEQATELVTGKMAGDTYHLFKVPPGSRIRRLKAGEFEVEAPDGTVVVIDVGAWWTGDGEVVRDAAGSL